MISGADIKATRLRVGESQMAFAKRLGIDQGTLSRWEAGAPPRGPARLLVEHVLSELSEAAA